jgi:hypothetical protein
VDRRIGLSGEQGGLYLADEHAPAADFPDWQLRAAVARRGDCHQLDLQAGMGCLQQGSDVARLPQGQRAAPGGQA